MHQGALMTSRRARAALAALAVAAFAAACGTEIPANVVVPGERVDADLAVAQDSASSQLARSSPSTAHTISGSELSLDAKSRAKPRALSYDLTYPPMMRTARVEGTVVAAFVVDTNGRVDMNSVWVISSDHEQFTTAVERALVTTAFDAARVNGKPVRQAIEQPFVFALGMDLLTSKLDWLPDHEAVAVVVPENRRNRGVGEAVPQLTQQRFSFQLDR